MKDVDTSHIHTVARWRRRCCCLDCLTKFTLELEDIACVVELDRNRRYYFRCPGCDRYYLFRSNDYDSGLKSWHDITTVQTDRETVNACVTLSAEVLTAWKILYGPNRTVYRAPNPID